MSKMDMGGAGPGGSGDEQEASSSHKRKKSSKRHTEEQIKELEKFFVECPHPDRNQQRQLGRILGLEQYQIKFWFQNKRTHAKAQNERSKNSVLRAQNENINTENLAIKEVLKCLKCKSCAGPAFAENGQEQTLQNLQQENALLKEEHEKVCSLLSTYTGKPISELVALASALGSSLHLLPGSSLNDGIGSSGLDLNFGLGPAISDNNMLHYCMREITDMEREVMSETATSAMKELVRLLRADEILWVKSTVDGRLVLRRDIYEKIFPNTYHFKSSSAYLESSKDSRIVSMSRMQLVDMFLDSDKWVDLFPTIVTKAKTIQVLQGGLPGNRDGALQLMHVQIHILSPLVPPRDFFFLRYCQQIESGIWVIMDVSIDDLRENTSRPRFWKLPSGCMIQEMPNGTSMVTWVEHVEVDEKTQTHGLYRGLGSNIAYGAERWVITLKRMCERFEYSFGESRPSQEALGVISLPEGRRSILKLAHRMVKNFCEMLNMSSKLDFPHSEAKCSHGVQVSIRKNTGPGKPGGVIVSMATSLWLPLPYQSVFDFLTDKEKRAQWDVLSNGFPAHEIAHISNGTHPGNCTSIIQPFNLSEINLLILQETCIDLLGSLIVYAPIDMSTLNVAIRGEDSSNVPILASGFLISKDGKPNTVAGASSSRNVGRSGGSLLTAAFQILISSSLSRKELNMELVTAVNALLCSTVEKIKVALNCSRLD